MTSDFGFGESRHVATEKALLTLTRCVARILSKEESKFALNDDETVASHGPWKREAP